MYKYLTLYLFFLVLSCSYDKSTTPDVEESSSSEDDLIVMTISLAELMGQFEPSEHWDFAKIPDTLTDKPSLYLRKEALDAYLRMYEAARAEGLRLMIRSATRNFDYQKGIWEGKWRGQILNDGVDMSNSNLDPRSKAQEILRWSAMPGSSRHHWGTDIDLNAFDNEYFTYGEGLRLYNWLQANAASYGFCQPYTAIGANRPYGYQEEKWHWSYMPLSSIYTQSADHLLADTMFTGFEGSETAVSLQIKDHYVLGIQSGCFP